MKAAFRIISLVSLLTLRSLGAPEDTQTIFIPAQTVIFDSLSGGKGGSHGTGFTSYCIEKHKDEPALNPQQKMVPFHGGVEFQTGDGKWTKSYTLTEAIVKRFIQLTPPSPLANPDGGDDGYLSLSRGVSGDDFVSARFTASLVAPEGATISGTIKSEFFDALKAASIGSTDRDTTEDKIWDTAPQLFTFSQSQRPAPLLEGESVRPVLTLSKINRSQKRPVSIRFLEAPSGGTAIIINDPQGNVIAIDTAFGKVAGDRLAALLCEEVKQTKGRNLFIFATHPDADHIAGLEAHFRDAPCKPTRILRSQTAQPKLENRFSQLGGMYEPNPPSGFQKKSIGQGTMELLHSAQLTSDYLSRHETTKLLGRDVVGVVSEVEDSELVSDGYCRLSLARWKLAKSVNEHSIVTRFTHNEVSTLQLGDANTRMIAAMLKTIPKADRSQTGEDELRSHILVWPHHHWCPSDEKDMKVLKQFLARVKPQVIVFTSPTKSAGKKQSRERLEKFMKEYKKSNAGVMLHWLSDGELEVITDLCRPGQVKGLA